MKEMAIEILINLEETLVIETFTSANLDVVVCLKNIFAVTDSLEHILTSI